MAAVRQLARRWRPALVVCLVGCLNTPADPPRGTHSLRMADILNATPGLASPTSAPKIDPQAVRLTVTPVESTSPVSTQRLLIATVTDTDGQPRHNRRVEWRLSGVGRIVEVDEGLNGRGRKVDDRLAVGQTVLVGQTLQRGAGEEVRIQPGQSWCVITSPAEGDSVVTVTAPEVVEPAARQVTVTEHWTEADWRFPAPAACSTGAQPVLVTQILRAHDRQPLANYRVHYRVVDGPAAGLSPGGGREAVVLSDARGEARAQIAQQVPEPGVSRIAIEVYRPDSKAPSGSGIVAGRGETTVEWQPSQVALRVDAPAAVAIGQEIPITVTATNTARVATRPLVVALPLPEGTQVQFSEPVGQSEGGQLVWRLPGLAAGEARAVRAVFRAPRAGILTSVAAAQTADGLTTQAQATVRVGTPDLRVRLFGPRDAAVGERADFEVEVANPGDAPVVNVVVRAEIDAALEHASRAGTLEVKLGTLSPRETRTVPLPLAASQPGRPRCRALAQADGNLQAQAEATVAVVQRALWLGIGGPATRYLGRPGTWDVRVANPGELPLANVEVRVAVPPTVRLQSLGGGRLVGTDIVWRVDELKQGVEQKFTLAGTPTQLAPALTITGVAKADGVPEQRAEAALEVLGMPVLRVEIVPPAAALEAGKKAVYTVRVINQGSLAATGVAVTVTGGGDPPHLRPLHGTGPGVGRPAPTGGIVFTQAPRVEPRQALTYLVEVAAEKPGDGRLRVEMVSDTAAEPVVVEEATRVLPARPPDAPKPPATIPAAIGG